MMNLDQIETFLENYFKPRLTRGEKADIKNKIFSSIARPHEMIEPKGVLQRLLLRLRELGRSVSISPLARVMIKEMLLARIEKPSFTFSSLWAGHRRLAAAGVALVLVLFAVFNPAFSIPKLEAKMLTTIESVRGTVMLERNGKRELLRAETSLLENDVIRTGKDGFAAIRYFDGSVSRLAGDTEIKFTKLKIRKNLEPLAVEVNLTKGQIWSRALKGIDVKVGEIIASPHALSAFNVEAGDDGQILVSVWRNVVDLSLEKNGKRTWQSVKRGYQAKKRLLNQNPVVTFLPEGQEKKWVKENLEADKASAEKEKENFLNTDTVGVLPGNPLYAVKTLQENAALIIQFDEGSKKELQLGLAKKRFLEGVELIKVGKNEEASKVFAEFQKSAESLAEDVSAKQEVNRMAAELRQTFLTVAPTDPLYAAKLVITSVELETAENRVEQEKKRILFLSDRLIEAQILEFDGKTEEAKEKVGEYHEATEEVRLAIEELPKEAKRELIPYFLEKQAENMPTLQTLTVVPNALTQESAVKRSEFNSLPAEGGMEEEPAETETGDTLSRPAEFLPESPELPERLPSRIELLE